MKFPRHILGCNAIISGLLAAGLGFAPTTSGAVTATFTDTYTRTFKNKLGIEIGTDTWQTRVDLIVPETILHVGEIGAFTILANVSNFGTGVSGLFDDVATVFGFPTFPTGNVISAQPFNSFITIDGAKVFVGPKNDWKLRAFDQVSSGTSEFSGEIGGFGAKYTSTVQGPSVADWFEPIGESAQKVKIENRVLSESNHGKFTGAGASFRIDGFFQDLGVGVSNLRFFSFANYSARGFLLTSSNEIYSSTVIDLKIPVTSVVPEPDMGILILCGLASAGGLAWTRRGARLASRPASAQFSDRRRIPLCHPW